MELRGGGGNTAAYLPGLKILGELGQRFDDVGPDVFWRFKESRNARFADAVF
jgi:hypothetical protein